MMASWKGRCQPLTPNRRDIQQLAVPYLLGAAHDLSDIVRTLGSGETQYGRITTGRYTEFAGD